MKVSTFLAALRDRDIQVWVDGDQLRCSAPVGTLTSELRDDLRRYKREIGPPKSSYLDSSRKQTLTGSALRF